MSQFKTQKFNDAEYILIDVEGTTSDISFVKNVLFKYSAREMRNFLSDNKSNPRVRELISSMNMNSHEEAITQLLAWIRDDIKHPVLKELQGMIWRKGYEEKVYTAPLYEDVLPSWVAWHKAGFILGIFSSGSVAAQKLFFSYTSAGNVSQFLKDHFDLEIGSKIESASYLKIAERLKLTPNKILFLSDRPEELKAAQTAGLQVAHIVRPGTEPNEEFQPYTSFREL